MEECTLKDRFGEESEGVCARRNYFTLMGSLKWFKWFKFHLSLWVLFSPCPPPQHEADFMISRPLSSA